MTAAYEDTQIRPSGYDLCSTAIPYLSIETLFLTIDLVYLDNYKVKAQSRREAVQKFVLENVTEFPRDVARLAGERFGITRQAVNLHLTRLIKEGLLEAQGNTRNRTYCLRIIESWMKTYARAGLDEFDVWNGEIKVVCGKQPDNVTDIWDFAVTEMLNNAVDHSKSETISVVVKKTAVSTEIWVHDDGIGIFKKIQAALGLPNESHAVLELAKGKFTTDPKKHTGQGIFFTSRLLDQFHILSGGVSFSHSSEDGRDWIEERQRAEGGTAVMMKLSNYTSRTAKEVFDVFSDEEDYAFTKTVIPVKLAQYGSEKLISRSQAKRLLARVEVFKTVLFDFADVETIGQAFADQIFRVFANAHPEMELFAINTSREVDRMISRAKNTRQLQVGE